MRASKLLLTSILCFSSVLAHAGQSEFTHPLKQLRYSEQLEQYQFERATLDALQVSDPLELLNRRIYHLTTALISMCFYPR